MPRSRSKGKQSAGKTQSGSQSSKKKSEPKVFICPYTEQKVFIQRATLADLKNKSTYGGGKKRLWMLSSSQLRHELYSEAAAALASIEQASLPSFGGRSWEVTCGMSEVDGTTLFRTWKGKMELAVLPHLLETIPDPPTWPGRRGSQADEYFENDDDEQNNLQSREVSTLSSVAWDLKHQYSVPTVSIKWKSPDYKKFNSRKAAWEHATEIAKKETFIDKHILGLGASGKLLQPSIPSGPMALKVGKMRFERDGLWVVTQELSWQESRPQVLLDEEEKRLEREAELQAEEEEEEESDESEEERDENKEPEEEESESSDKSEGKKEARQRKLTPLSFYVKSRRIEYREERQASMEGKQKLTLLVADKELREIWKTLPDEKRTEWKEKLQKYLSSEEEMAVISPEPVKALMVEHLEEGKPMSVDDSGINTIQQTKTLMQGEEKNTADIELSNEAIESTKEGERLQKPISSEEEQGVIKLEPAIASLVENLEKTEPMPADDSEKNSNQQAETLMQVENNNSADIQSNYEAIESIKERTQPPAALMENKNPISNVTPIKVEETKSEGEQTSNYPSSKSNDKSTKKEALGVSTMTSMQTEEEKKEDESIAVMANDAVKEVELDLKPAPVASSFGLSLGGKDVSNPIHIGEIISSAPVSVPKKKAKRKSYPRKKKPTAQASQRWCLNNEQIDLCHEACMGHYEDVMRTVKARDLARELADGFDVLRERGRGRFDMELPVFGTPVFDFLTDLKKAPWMPIVNTILGDDITLIHKGCFLSMPDAETQVYHQDGVHLTTQTQKPCHAINVFVPLVDLTTRNGPTEFCLGSHILGNDGFDKDYVETPRPKAGTPVIFDYRLGHRGLGNSSTSYRPIVYCTYARGAAEGKAFRDSVNFSRKRYHKIGSLTEKPLSREERRLARKRSIEERASETEAKKILKLEQKVAKESQSDATTSPVPMAEANEAENKPHQGLGPKVDVIPVSVEQLTAVAVERTGLHKQAICLALTQQLLK